MKTGEILEFGEFAVDPSTRALWRNGEKVTLNRRSLEVLLYLVQRPGELVTRDDLMKGVWPDAFVDENSLTQSISALRRALEERPGDNQYVATVPGRGYQFLAKVRAVPHGYSEAGAGLMTGVMVKERTIQTRTVTEERMGRERARLGLEGRRAWLLGWILVVVVVVAGSRGVVRVQGAGV